ncbi:MAG: DNA polymerase II [Gammaproteobacteria bacterium]|nr:DNA polymerase II [Gammaproteobacteria bacterium]
MGVKPTTPQNTADAQLCDAFLLTRDWRDGDQGVELDFWARGADGAIRIVFTDQQSVCFFDRDTALPDDIFEGVSGPRQRKNVTLKTPSGNPVDALYLGSQWGLQRVRERAIARGLTPYEADVKPTDRHLMERFITGGVQIKGQPIRRKNFVEFINPALRPSQFRPRLRVVSLDIETSDLAGDLYSIALSGDFDERVLMVGASPIAVEGIDIHVYPSEADLLAAFLQWVDEYDPDVFIGWNVIGFDFDFLAKRCQQLNIPFNLGRNRRRGAIHPARGPNQVALASVPGRVILDGIECLRAAFWTFEDYSLQAVSHQMLGASKDIATDADRVGEIRRLYAEDPVGLAKYNLQDCRLVTQIFAKTDLLEFCIERSQLTGLTFGRAGGSVAAFDNLYLPRLHRRGFVAPDTGTSRAGGTSPGGHVLDSKPGLYSNVALLDFKSLYPSIICSFGIDPRGMWAPGEDPIPGFAGALFSRDGAILPDIISDLSARRDEAKKLDNQPLSQAIKIIMNSFYGVLGANGCRFVDPKLTSSITRRGHEIIQRSRDLIQAQGFEVIYGDTDSLFVLLPETLDEHAAAKEAQALGAKLNTWWTDTLAREYRVTSRLEIEFEHLFLRFLMPTVRGTEVGTKKRYAGMVRAADQQTALVFKGLEVVRTDWTELARRFQRELYRRIFADEPFEDYVRDIDAQLVAGHFDAELVYRKRLRRPINEYVGTGPPHVQAARKLGTPTRWIRYVLTRSGPEPVDTGPHALDYEHYRTRQLAPVADAILQFQGASYESLTTSQLQIF